MKADLSPCNLSEDLEALLQSWRQRLHTHPEIAFEEKQTAAFVAQSLREFGLEVHEGVGRTGVVGILKCGSGKKTIALRADMDALPIQEESDMDYASQEQGKMHACGHDGHTAMLLGAARELSRNPQGNGTVLFLFQPAEETGEGALAMLKEGLFDRFPVDEIYGMHNMPNLPFGTVSVREGSLMASEDAFAIEITGKRAHAAFPHQSIDPIVIGAEIVLALQSIVSRKLNPLESAVLSITDIATDGAENVIPNSLRLTGTVRTLSAEVQSEIEKQIQQISKGIAALHGAQCAIDYRRLFINTRNTAEPTRFVVEAATAILGKENVNGDCSPVMASEDFGYMLRDKPGCYFFLGTAEEGRENFGLHHQKFDFNDRALLTGVRLWLALIAHRLSI